MGLDAVDLVLCIEEAFGIEIAVEDYGGLKTVGQLHDYIVRKSAFPDDDVWESLRSVIVRTLHVQPEEITAQTRFIEDLKLD